MTEQRTFTTEDDLAIACRALDEEVTRLRIALEIIAGRRQCLDNLMGNVDVACSALDHRPPFTIKLFERDVNLEIARLRAWAEDEQRGRHQAEEDSMNARSKIKRLRAVIEDTEGASQNIKGE